MAILNRLCATTALALMTALPLNSQAAGPYVGVNLGASHHNIDCGPNSCKSSGTGSKLYGGYLFSNNIGAEAVYINFDKATSTSGGAVTKWESSGIGVAAVGSFKLGDKFEALARLGLLFTKADTTLPSSTKQSQNSVAPLIGVGIAFKATEAFWIRGEIDLSAIKFNNNGTGYTDRAGVQLFSIGVSYSF